MLRVRMFCVEIGCEWRGERGLIGPSVRSGGGGE
jgi:hypothetical protein